MRIGKYKITFKDGTIKYAEAMHSDSLVLLLGGVIKMIKDVKTIEASNKDNEWILTRIVDHKRVSKPTNFAKWVDN